MRYFSHLLFITFLLLALTSCSSNPTSLDRQKLSKNKISLINLSAPETITYERSTKGVQAASGFGFIGGLTGSIIDESVNASRNKSLQPIIKSLTGYNVRNSLNAKLAKLSGNSFKPGLKVTNQEIPAFSELNSLGVQANYTLSANHQFVMVNANTKLKTSEDKAPYTRMFNERSQIPLNLKKGQKLNVTQFLIDNPQILKNTIETTLNKIVKKISDDINIGPVKK